MRAARYLRPVILCVVFAGLVPLIGLVQIELERRPLVSRAEGAQAYYLPPAQVLRGLAFGYTELFADAIWIRTIAYFTDHAFSDRDLRHLQRYLESALALDERFKAIYRYGSAMLMSRGERQTNADVWAAIRLLERAQRIYPEDHTFPLHLGAYYMSDLRTKDPAERARWRRKGADWVRRAALVGANLPWLPLLAAKVYTEQGERDLAIRHLRELYVASQDPKMKQNIMLRLRELEGQEAASFASQTDALLERHKASRYGFVPLDLAVVLDLEPRGPFDPFGAQGLEGS